MMFCTTQAWGFRDHAEPVSRWASVRPYWINPPAGRSRDLTDEQILTELTRAGWRKEDAERVVQVTNELEKGLVADE
jgi:hypothetical protein